MSAFLSIISAFFCVLLLSGCAIGPTTHQTLHVAAAADLGPLTDSLASLYHDETGKSLRFVIGSSGILARQIEQGAPFDVYLSANARYVDDLAKAGKLVPSSVRHYALGRLGIWWKKGQIRDAKELLRPEVERIAIANPAHAPYGEAARDYLQRAGIWEQLEPKLIFGENVRQAAQFATSGNADALISSWTLVAPMGGTLVPPEAHAPIQQAGGVLATSAHPEDARRFLRMLGEAKARTLFEEHGFGLPDSAETH